MIKIHYKDFVVELDSFKEAMDSMDAKSEPRMRKIPAGYLPEVSERIIKEKKVKVVRRKKSSGRVTWTPAEVRHIIENLDSQGPKAIVRSSFLNRHTLTANKQMVWRIRANWKSKTSRLNPELQGMIDAYHETREKAQKRYVPLGEYIERG